MNPGPLPTPDADLVGSTGDAFVRLAAAALIANGRVLLCHRTKTRLAFPDVWDLPGGHVEAGERPAQTIVRELQEELAIEVVEPMGRPWEIQKIPGLQMSVFVFVDWKGVPENAAPEEHDEIAWFGRAHLPNLSFADASYPAMFSRLFDAWKTA